MDRRGFLKNVMGAGVAVAAMRFGATLAAAPVPVTKTDAEWRAALTPEQFGILRHEDTERPYNSPLLDEHRAGVFACVGCDLPLFAAKTKFDSGTGWPSFYDHLPDALATKCDYAIMFPRTEYHCARCGGHHGHVFDDGPAPTGLRYCSNGAVLKFIPDAA